MPSYTKRMYPRSGRINLDGGLNNKYARSEIQDNESPDCANVIFGDGTVETRGGTSKLNTGTVGTFVCDGLYTRHDNSGSQTMVAWFGGTLYDYQSPSFVTIGSAQSIYTAGERVHAAEYENYIFFGNGNNTPYKYGGDGDTFTRHGIPAPTSTMSVATASTGSALTGDYQYKVTYVNSNLVESDVGPVTATFTASSENALITSIPVAPQSFGVNQRYLYRTVSSGTAFLRLATIADNTTTTYEDAISDANLGAAAPTDQGEPPNYSAIIYHQARLFVIDPSLNLVKYSEIGNPYVFKSTSFLRIGDNTADIPIGLAIYDNSLVVFCERHPWIVYMPTTSDSDWSIQRIRAPYGSKSPFGAFQYDNKLMYPAVQNDKFVGFAAIEGQTISPSASLLTSTALGAYLKSDVVEPDMFLVQEAYLGNITSMVYQNKAYITVTYGNGNTTNNRMYVFDFSLGRLERKQKFSWVPWTGLSANDYTILDGTLYYGTSTATGYVYQMNTGTYNDDGAGIDSYYWTKEFSGEKSEIEWTKDFRYLELFYELPGDYFMDFFYRVDSDSGSGNKKQIDLNPGGSLWGTAVLGADLWGGGSDETEERQYVAPIRGKRIQFKFSNQAVANQKFKVIGMRFEYNLKGER